jgi:hypothetical protein
MINSMDILFIIFAALFMSLLCVVMRHDTETFQNIRGNTKTFFNKHRRAMRHSFKETYTTLLTQLKRNIRLSGY